MTAGVDRAIFVNSRRLGSFSFSEDHPFKPARVARVHRMCERRGLFSAPGLRVVDVEEPEEGVLERFHTPEYIDALRRADSGAEVDLDMLHHGIGSMENPVFRGVWEFSALSATASLVAARAVAAGAESAFNPCGGFHHARPDRAAGFCYANDIAIAIGELRAAGLRTAYVDIDAHHGDAVQDAFYDDPEVLTVSIHETGKTLFPWGGFERETGEGAGRGFNVNVALEPETDDEIFARLFDGIVMDALDRYDPEVVVAQVGTDMLSTDPLTHLRLTNNGYIEAIERLHRRFPRILALGGGGYRMDDVVRGWTLVWVELSGQVLDAGYGGALGGVFLGDPSIEGSDLRDMRLYTTGPVKERLGRMADRAIEQYRTQRRPLIARKPER
ncbi:MAG: acetoin utilization protein AcuC [Candidatus Krumholzibacteriota bacterium]|nr:acetoin utilization protein AcuC [Candidatus Krumholzibacteriota bacterium]